MNLNFKILEILVDKEVTKGNFTRIYVQPLEIGYLLTIGTALRRIMLSAMSGTSVVSFHMKGVTHKLMTMLGTATDAVELVSDLKKIKFNLEEDVEIEIFVKKGRCYVQDKDHCNLNIDGIIKIDGLFSPIHKVGISSK
ncbi:hypothetical protein SFC65_20215 [Priestia filamentosa]|uniref:hypothetical protein n=1 Tax=Priestia filamentosa TaxID=1402861 RepID=UPI003981E4D9